nr:hypothetical protein [uncultured Sphingomonas sp.]
MRGAADALRRNREAVLFGAWATERFAREERLRSFGHYRSTMLGDGDKPTAKAAPQALLAQFQALQAEGISMTIKKVRR